MNRLAVKLRGAELLSYWGNRTNTFVSEFSPSINDIILPWNEKMKIANINFWRSLPLGIKTAYHIQRRLWREKLGKTIK